MYKMFYILWSYNNFKKFKKFKKMIRLSHGKITMTKSQKIWFASWLYSILSLNHFVNFIMYYTHAYSLCC